ncbi:MAG: DUF1285 domain-containing protein [Siculibacillus sp.]
MANTSDGTAREPDGGVAGRITAALGRVAGTRGPAPVERWNPPFCGDIDMRIAADGSWHYCGSPIGREAMVRLFASVLRRDEDGKTYLVTPVEKCGITVEDVPFLAVELTSEGEGEGRTIGFRTNVGDTVVVDADHPLRFARDPLNGGLKPYVLVRGRLEARLTRSVLHDLVEAGATREIDGVAWFGVWSAGRFFPAARVDEIGEEA